LRTLQNEHGGPELDGGRRSGIVEDCEEGFQGAVAEMVEVVAAGEARTNSARARWRAAAKGLEVFIQR